MAKPPANHGKQRALAEIKQLAQENTPTPGIGLKLGRTEDAVRAKAGENNIFLKPTNPSPSNRRTPCVGRQ